MTEPETSSNEEKRKYKYLDKETLQKINYVSDKIMKYNRVLDPAAIDELPDGLFFPVVPVLIHEHIAGKPADPHMRCLIYTDFVGKVPFILDIEMGLYDLLPSVVAPIENVPPRREVDEYTGNSGWHDTLAKGMR
jgi:hypothetical protein